MRRFQRRVLVKETFNPIPEGMKRLKFERGGRNVEVALDYHRFDLGDYDLILKGVDVNRIKMPEGVDVFEYHINGRRVYSDFTMDELIEIY